jgi:hypothetical protein
MGQERSLSTLISISWPFRQELAREDHKRNLVSEEAIHAE